MGVPIDQSVSFEDVLRMLDDIHLAEPDSMRHSITTVVNPVGSHLAARMSAPPLFPRRLIDDVRQA